ncbi:hypothetical protein [Agromyces sp. NPDC056965]|uniref:hypothetical protein n=1 Tax=Agromyces sp. NPDC056965 TaxID=3345983 RepID=UPI003642AFBD
MRMMRGSTTRSTATQAAGPATAAAAAALMVLTAFTGCSGASADADEATATLKATDAAAQIVSIPMPAFAPWPASDPFTDADVEAARLAEADRDWQGVLASYPGAVRPEVVFEAYVTDENRVDVMRACYEAAALPIDEGRTGTDPDSPVDAIGTSTTTVEQAIAAHSCRVAHPNKRTSGPPNAEQLGWIYDYLTEYYVPCFELNDIVVPPAPPRAEFVANWPNQGWFPSVGDHPMAMDQEWSAAVSEACVDPDTAIMTGLVERAG